MLTYDMANTMEVILRRVAAGELTPDEALPLIDAANRSAPGNGGGGAAAAVDAGTESSTEPSTESGADTQAGSPADGGAGTGAQPDTGAQPGTGAQAGTGARAGTGAGSGGSGWPGSGAGSATPPWGTAPGPAGSAGGGEPISSSDHPKRIRVAVSYRALRIIADPGVTGAFVSGEHTVRREGDTLVVEASGLPLFTGDDDEPGTGGRFSFSNLPRTIAKARALQNESLIVRFNPYLPIELDVAGASVRITGGEAGARLRLLASALKVDTLRGPLDLDAVSSSVKGTLGPSGSSRISAESSSVKVSLLAGTGLRIHARNRMGKVVLPTGVTKGDMVDPGIRESVVGDGRDELTVESVMSSVVIGADVIGAGSPWGSSGVA